MQSLQRERSATFDKVGWRIFPSNVLANPFGQFRRFLHLSLELFSHLILSESFLPFPSASFTSSSTSLPALLSLFHLNFLPSPLSPSSPLNFCIPLSASSHLFCLFSSPLFCLFSSLLLFSSSSSPLLFWLLFSPLLYFLLSLPLLHSLTSASNLPLVIRHKISQHN